MFSATNETWNRIVSLERTYLPHSFTSPFTPPTCPSSGRPHVFTAQKDSARLYHRTIRLLPQTQKEPYTFNRIFRIEQRRMVGYQNYTIPVAKLQSLAEYPLSRRHDKR